MSKRSHHRNRGININELADALTQRGWQPPRHELPATNMMMQGGPMGNGSGNNSMNNSLSALSGLLGAVNGGNIPPGNIMPMQGTMPMQHRMPHQQPNEQDLLRALFQQTIRTLKNE